MRNSSTSDVDSPGGEDERVEAAARVMGIGVSTTAWVIVEGETENWRGCSARPQTELATDMATA